MVSGWPRPAATHRLAGAVLRERGGEPTQRRRARGRGGPRSRPAAVDAPPVDGHVRGPCSGAGPGAARKGDGAPATPPGPLRRSAQAGPGRSGRGPGRVAPPSRGPAGPSPRPLPLLAIPGGSHRHSRSATRARAIRQRASGESWWASAASPSSVASARLSASVWGRTRGSCGSASWLGQQGRGTAPAVSAPAV